MPNEHGLHPQSGTRFLFERSEDAGDRASYKAAILTPDTRIDYTAALDEAGGATLEPVGDAAAPELEKKLENIAIVIARGAKKKRADGLAPWPHRVTRWRR